MADINPKGIFEIIKKNYLSFILTTVCRDNKKLYEELKNFFLDSPDLLWRDLIIQEVPKYKTVTTGIAALNFSDGVKELIRGELRTPYVHQIQTWKKALAGENCVVATGTGSGKTEAFIMPILDYCATNYTNGVQAIVIYPMKALANDQGKRIGDLIDKLNEITGKKLTFALLDGDTEKRSPLGAKSEIFTKEEIANNPPNILLTNYVMLERILLYPQYIRVLQNSKIRYIVLDEIHYYRGAQGIDVSLLMRRLQFYLRLNNNPFMQYIGTSATISTSIGTKSQYVENFLFKLFNVTFKKDNIVLPVFDEKCLIGTLCKPIFLSDLKEKLDNIEIRAHAFFCAPPSLFRCLKCNHIHVLAKDKCQKCSSKLVFEISTCRQCGKEYLVYPFLKNKQSDINLKDIDIIKAIKPFNGQEVESRGEIVLSKEQIQDSQEKLKLCEDCLSIYSDSSSIHSCPICASEKYIYVYPVEEDNEKPTILTKEKNDKFCPFCNFEESRQPLIVPVSKISDENTSHIIFDELFMALPKQRQKLLVFTDNVQRTSKFAREIEETHLKNIARSYLNKKIEEISKPVTIDDLIHQVMRYLKRYTTVTEYLELNLKKELYDELLGSGRKVASLANRGVFTLGVVDVDSFPEQERINVIKAFEVFKEKKQVLDYYKIVNSAGIHAFQDFLDNSKLVERVFRNMRDLRRKKIKNMNLTEAKQVIELLKKKQYLDEFEGKYFFKEQFMEVCAGKRETTDVPNYYDEWKNRDEIPFIKTEIYTGKTDAEKRTKIIYDFKTNDSINFLVSTTTLELGIDISDLDVVGLLYAPPSPAQYTQRIGRAGRKGLSSFSVTFLSKRTLDSMYFYNPKELVLGEITPPMFDIDLEIPIKKSLFSVYLYFLLKCTDFTKKQECLGWNKIKTWELYFDKIKIYLKEHEKNFIEFLTKYSEISKINIQKNNLVDEWIEKLGDHINLQKSIKASDLNPNQSVFNYFQEAGLLPDYAFGSGGTVVIVPGRDMIKGFMLKEVCPPSTLDFEKNRYSCEKISLKPYHFKKLSNNYKYCGNCRSVISLKESDKECNICTTTLIPINNELIEPKVINGRRSAFSLTQKYVKWDFSIIDIPKDIIYVNDIVTKPFASDVGMVFNSVMEGDTNIPYFICKECGYLYSKNTKRKDENHVHKDATWKIASKFKTQVVILDLTEYNIRDKTTLLNALISASAIEAGCEDGEIAGFSLLNEGKFVLFDNVEGGVGFVNVLSEKLMNVLKNARDLCGQSCCENGCIRCIGSFWRQNELTYLRKRDIIPILDDLIKEYGDS
ncbi:MAG: DEAD/DEAH box helicase [Candidatus Woesearchaeota archaeon]